MTATTNPAKSAFLALADSLGLSITSVFVPWSASRNAGEDRPSLNWKVTVWKAQPANHITPKREILTTDYMAGMGHCPSYKQGQRTLIEAAVVRKECETGQSRGKPILPDPADVLGALVLDADALNHPTFEEWAADMDVDPDSRKWEQTYRLCVSYGLALRAAVGDDGLRQLTKAAREL